jgi:hypothetical protein
MTGNAARAEAEAEAEAEATHFKEEFPLRHVLRDPLRPFSPLHWTLSPAPANDPAETSTVPTVPSTVVTYFCLESTRAKWSLLPYSLISARCCVAAAASHRLTRRESPQQVRAMPDREHRPENPRVRYHQFAAKGHQVALFDIKIRLPFPYLRPHPASPCSPCSAHFVSG